MDIRGQTQRNEEMILSKFATLSARSAGRDVEEEPCSIRTCFQRDVDRITYCKAFRRLKHKTQVFLQPEGDHYRTRLTHTLEVNRIARTIARALSLNEDLTEAIALGHDLGHTPFGHAGEKALHEIVPGGFSHNEQSLRVVQKLEKGGKGLNLTKEVQNGIVCHRGGVPADTPEGQIIHVADRIGYINHDIDDAVRAGILREGDIPKDLCDVLGHSHSRRIDTLVRNVIEKSRDRAQITMSDEIYDAMMSLREFMFERVYRNNEAKSEEAKVRDMMLTLYDYYRKNPDKLPQDYKNLLTRESVERTIADYIAGMTDRYAVIRYSELFIPKGWGSL